MANIVSQYNFGSIKTFEDFKISASVVFEQLIDALNGKLDFGNLKTQTISVTFPNANTNYSISHNLKKTGVNYLVVSKNAATDIYRGSGDTTSVIVLKATVATTVTLILF